MLNWFIKRRLCMGLVCLLPAGILYAQEKDTTTFRTLSEVEVVEKARPSVTRAGAPLQVMSRTEIERLGVQDLSEAVKRFSGVTVKDYGGIGGLKTVSVRSLGAQHTAVSYDGVTITDAQSGQVDISRFSLDNVESVSLSIGQTDDIFQTARMYASAGGLSIRTSRPDFATRPFQVRAQIRGGSFGLINPYLKYEQKISRRWSASLDGDFLRADGQYPFTLTNVDQKEELKRKNSDIESWHIEANLFGRLGQQGELSAKVYSFDSERGLPGSVILYNDYAGERLWDKNTFVQVYYKNQWGKQFALQAQAKYNYVWNKYLDENNKYESGYQEDRYTQREYYTSVSGLYSPIEHLSFSLAEDFFLNTLDNTLPNNPLPTRYSSLTVAAAQYKDSRLTVTGSLLGTFITERVETGDRPDDRKRLSPAASASWRIFSGYNWRVRASYKDIFRIPTFNDLYYQRFGNTKLKPERAKQYNVGLTWSGRLSSVVSSASLSADAYYNRVHDKIVALPTMFIWKMMNFGEVSIKGAEVNGAIAFSLPHTIGLYLQGNYTYQKAIDITKETAKNYRHQIPYTPRHAGTASVSVQNPWVNITYKLSAVGDRYALPQNIEDNLIGRYVEHGLSVNREFEWNTCRIRLQGEVLNLGDIDYEVIQYYPMPGRSWRLSLQLIY